MYASSYSCAFLGKNSWKIFMFKKAHGTQKLCHYARMTMTWRVVNNNNNRLNLNDYLLKTKSNEVLYGHCYVALLTRNDEHLNKASDLP